MTDDLVFMQMRNHAVELRESLPGDRGIRNPSNEELDRIIAEMGLSPAFHDGEWVELKNPHRKFIGVVCGKFTHPATKARGYVVHGKSTRWGNPQFKAIPAELLRKSKD